MKSTNKSEDTALLIVNDDKLVCSHLHRVLKTYFDDVLSARNSAQATEALKLLKVTHVFCEFDLGPLEPNGFDLIVEWRAAYPEIRRAIVVTDVDTSRVAEPQEVDAVVLKKGGVQVLLKALFAH